MSEPEAAPSAVYPLSKVLSVLTLWAANAPDSRTLEAHNCVRDVSKALGRLFVAFPEVASLGIEVDAQPASDDLPRPLPRPRLVKDILPEPTPAVEALSAETQDQVPTEIIDVSSEPDSVVTSIADAPEKTFGESPSKAHEHGEHPIRFNDRELAVIDFLEANAGVGVTRATLRGVLPRSLTTAAANQLLTALRRKLFDHPDFRDRFETPGSRVQRTWRLASREAQHGDTERPSGPGVPQSPIETVASAEDAEPSKKDSEAVCDEKELTILTHLLSNAGTNVAYEDLLELVGNDDETMRLLLHKLQNDPKYESRLKVTGAGSNEFWRIDAVQAPVKPRRRATSKEDVNTDSSKTIPAEEFLAEYMLNSQGAQFTGADLERVLTDTFTSLSASEARLAVNAFKDRLKHHPLYSGYVHYSGNGGGGKMWFEEPVAKAPTRTRLTEWGLERDGTDYLVNGRALGLSELGKRCLGILIEYSHGINPARVRDMLQEAEDAAGTKRQVTGYHVQQAVGEIRIRVSRFQSAPRLHVLKVPKGAGTVSILKLDV